MSLDKLLVCCLVAIFGLVFTSAAQPDKPPSRNVLNTPHNLSVSGGGGSHDLRSVTEKRVCIFCHTPHHATSVTPLWSRDISPLSIYVPYMSSTLQGNPQQPRGASRICLSCHDGTIALGLLAGGHSLDPTLPKMPADIDPGRNPNLGLDLSDDHPVSFVYPFGMNLELNDPAILNSRGIKLEQGEYVECTSCHDPHNNQFGNFLVKDVSSQHDSLCTECHVKAGWNDSDAAHRSGGTRFPGVASQVAADGCLSCHRPHSAEKGEYLLKLAAVGAGEESNCYNSCHRDAPYTNVWNQFNTALYTHPVQNYIDLHKADEALPLSAGKKHVECVDCHNPHQAGWQGTPLGDPAASLPSVAPYVSGPLRGVRGVDSTGMAVVAPARYEFEICFRCHAGISAGQFVSLSAQKPQRLYSDDDESSRFSAVNPSVHPLTSDRRGSGRSLRSDYQSGMLRIYCNDCHDSHGSNQPHMLREENPDTFPLAAISNYPLCFQCHDPDFLLDPLRSPHADSVLLHQKHVLGLHNNGDSRQTPCSVCHDPHGTPLSQGANLTNAAHLINFDTRYTGLSPVYDAVDGSCSVSCHQSNPRSYP